MRNVLIATAVAVLTCAPGSNASAQPTTTATTAQAPHAGVMTTSTTLIGDLLDNPASRAVLEQQIPEVLANPMFQQNARPMKLTDIQQYEPTLTAAKLAAIDAALAALPHS